MKEIYIPSGNDLQVSNEGLHRFRRAYNLFIFVVIVLAAGGIVLLLTLLQSKEMLRWWGEKVDKLIAWMVERWPGKV